MGQLEEYFAHIQKYKPRVRANMPSAEYCRLFLRKKFPYKEEYDFEDHMREVFGRQPFSENNLELLCYVVNLWGDGPEGDGDYLLELIAKILQAMAMRE